MTEVHIYRCFIDNTQIIPIQNEICIKSIILHNHKVNLWVHEPGQENCFPNHILNKCIIRYVSKELKCYETIPNIVNKFKFDSFDGDISRVFAPYSDIVRIEILYKFGGWWLDDDNISLKELPQINNEIGIKFASEFNWYSSFRNDIIPTTCCIYSKPGNDLIKIIMDIQEHKLLNNNRSYIELGPLILRELFEDGKINNETLFRPEEFFSLYNMWVDEFKYDNMNFYSLSRYISSHSIHISGLSNDVLPTYGSILYNINDMVSNGISPTYNRLLDLFKSNESIFYNYIKKKRCILAPNIGLQFKEMYEHYKKHEKQ